MGVHPRFAVGQETRVSQVTKPADTARSTRFPAPSEDFGAHHQTGFAQTGKAAATKIIPFYDFQF
jgi:hypothetical protein